MRIAIQAISHILDSIVNTLQSDSGELLLTRQGGRSLLLTCHTGEASRAFEERLEFQAGEGFLGPTLATGSLLESSNLLTEKRSRRNSVKRAGFRRHIGTPIIGPTGRHGVIGVASRDPNPHVPLLLSIITAVYALLGLRLEAVMAPLQAAVRNYLTHAGNVKEQTGAMHRMLEQIARFTDASNAEPYIANEGTSPTRITTPSLSGPQCSLLASSGFAICPAYTSGQPRVRKGSRQPWRISPHPTRKDVAVWCCTPL